MTDETRPEQEQLSPRWWVTVAFVFVGAVWFFVIQVLGWHVTHPSRDLVYGICGLNLAYYIWTRAWSGFGPSGQMCSVSAVVLLQLILYGLFRTDGFDGDGRLIFKTRWTPTADESLDQYVHIGEASAGQANFSAASEFDSPAFRGHDRTGYIRNSHLLLDWDQRKPRELWRHPVGRGWSSFAVVGDYCVTQEQLGEYETTVCYNIKTGERIWRHQDRVRFDEVTSGPGPRATPAIADGNVYAIGATGILNCLSGSDGRLIWTRNVAGDQSILFGYSGSPLVHEDIVYVAVGGQPGSVIAIDRPSGETIWSNGSSPGSYSSPHLLLGPEPQVLIFDATGLHAFDGRRGDLRWSFDWGTGDAEEVNVCQPVVLSDLHRDEGSADLLISSGYGRGAARIRINRDDDGDWQVKELWHSIKLKSKFSSIVLRNGYAFGLDQGILACISLTDGSLQWKKGRYGHGQLLLIDDVLLVQSESGRVILVDADPMQFNERGDIAGLDARTWNHPVVSGRYLLIRNDREAACYELNVAEPLGR